MKPLLAISELVFDPVIPMPLILLLAALFAALTFYSYFQLGQTISKTQNAALAFFRVAGLALIFLVLLQPSRREEIPPPKINQVTLVALDTSRSMNQSDVQKMSRLDAAKNLLVEADLVSSSGTASAANTRLFEFSNDSTPITSELENLKPEGGSTRIHRAVTSMLNSLSSGEQARALILLSDGHDFEMVNPAKTGSMARSRQTPIYAVPFGKQGKVRDVSVRIANYQPYSYVKQKARISSIVRLVGCEYEDLTIQLIRKNEIVQTKRLNADENSQLLVDFEVVEPEVGQFEYEIKIVPLENEITADNNSALTYLNVIDQQIQVLLLEGAPYWDTTFLQRSLMRNDKIDLDCILQYAENKARAIRKKTASEELKVPATQEEFNHYDVILLGKSVDRLLDAPRIAALQTYVKEHGGTVIFGRGKTFETETNELEPVIWDSNVSEKVSVQVSREGQSLAPFKMLAEQQRSGSESPPDLIAGHKIQDRKPLAAVLAQAQNRDSGESMPGFVHRRFGQGQVLSVGVDGLWRWAFNAKIEGANTMFDRFWDQMILWLMAGRDFLPNKQFSFRCNSANVLLGEKVYFKLVMRNFDPQVKSVPVTIFQGEKEIAKTALGAETPDAYRLTAQFLPEKIGKYRAVAALPDGSREETKFIVFGENLEDTEVATDLAYLKKLCESSGGRLLAPDELKKLRAELDDKQTEAAPKTRLVSIWDRAWIFYLIGLALGIDWYLRRKWGLC